MQRLKLKPLRTSLVIVGAVALAACGGGESEVASETAPAPEVEALAPAPTITPNAEPLASNHPNSIQPETTLSISAEGVVKREPDHALLGAGVQTEAETAEAAMQANAEAMSGVFRALEAADIDRKDMQTSGFSLQPRYDYSSRRDGQPPRLVGYTASNQLSVKVRDLDSLGETMDAMVGAGGNTFSGLSFGIEDERSARDEARRLAMNEAIARAELYAAASGYEVARIVTISESGGFAPQPMAMARMEADMASSTPIATGEVGYSVNVNIVFELRKPAN